LGAVILLLTRPFEGFLLVAPAAVALWLRTKQGRVWLPIAAVGLAGLSFQGLYDYRVTGHPLRMLRLEATGLLGVLRRARR